MQPHQQRVVDEKTELDERLTKLIAFFDNPVFAGLPADEQDRMKRQADHMTNYSVVLGERIAAFPADWYGPASAGPNAELTGRGDAPNF